VLLVHLGTPEEGEQFFESRWPEARAVSDQGEELYEAFGLKQGSLSQLLGPRVLLAGLMAVRDGVGKLVGNPRRMSGWFLVDGVDVVWSQVHLHAGALPRYGEIATAYQALRASSA
jgi:hypothetical protein